MAVQSILLQQQDEQESEQAEPQAKSLGEARDFKSRGGHYERYSYSDVPR